MVNLYLFNPASKLRLLSTLVFKTSKRALRNGHPSSSMPLKVAISEPLSTFNMKVFDLVQTDLHHSPRGGLIRDAEYYKNDHEGGMCTFRVENTLFKVYKCYLLREPCAFGDMFSLPYVKGCVEGQCDEVAIPLSDTAEQFRDLLWALHALPTELITPSEKDSPSLHRLLNIALLANKYCIASYEVWALDRIFQLAQAPNCFLRYEPPQTCAQVLEVAVLCGHQKLLDVSTHRLVTRMLWSEFDRRPILRVAESRSLTKLQGVAYYRDLTGLERLFHDSNPISSGPIFLQSIPDERQRRHLHSAYFSLVTMWERVRLTPPSFPLPPDECPCPSHADCLATWGRLWLDAASSSQTLKNGSADVLGRLKAMMVQLKKLIVETDNGMSIGCSMAALESITAARDDIVCGLIDHFRA